MYLLLTFVTGLFFLLGKLFFKNRNTSLLMGLAFILLIGLIVFELIPEIVKDGNVLNYVYILVGLFIFKIIDYFIPHHHHVHCEDCEDTAEHIDNFKHISKITIIALIFHNLVEGLALYNILNYSLESGLILFVGIILHNIPLGIFLSKDNLIYSALLIFSGFFGGLIGFIFGTVSESLTIALIALTTGFLLYITIFEIFKDIYHTKIKTNVYYGIIIGIILIIVIFLI